MSIERCADCSALIDTDAYPETYREEFNTTPLCDDCCEERIIAQAEQGGTIQ